MDLELQSQSPIINNMQEKMYNVTDKIRNTTKTVTKYMKLTSGNQFQQIIYY